MGRLSDENAKKRVTEFCKKITKEANSKEKEAEEEFMSAVRAQVQKDMEAEKAMVKAMIDKERKQLVNGAAIKKSLAVNQKRLEKITKRQEKISQIANDVKEQATDLAQNPDFLRELIVQSCLMLLEEKVKVRCRASDTDAVQALLLAAQDQYSKVIKDTSGADKSVTLEIDGENGLSEDLIGGVVLSVKDGDITVDNTIDARLGLVLEQDKPAIRKKLFKD